MGANLHLNRDIIPRMGGLGRPLRVAFTVALATLVAAACQGEWRTAASPSPVRTSHVALLHTGKVLLVAGSGNDAGAFAAGTFKTSLWDPKTEMFQSVATPWDAFCAGHAFLPDGRLLVAGGTTGYPSASTNNNYAGSREAFIFDPGSSQYVPAPDTAVARWYPSVVELGDGRLFTLGGFNEKGVRTRNSEIFDGSQWSDAKPPPAAMSTMPTYPAPLD